MRLGVGLAVGVGVRVRGRGRVEVGAGLALVGLRSRRRSIAPGDSGVLLGGACLGSESRIPKASDPYPQP